jgi:hypothetical protein
MKKFLPLVLASVMMAGSAQAAHVNVLGGLTTQSPSSDVPGLGSGAGFTFGATIDFDLNPLFEVETGLMSVGEKFSQTTAGIETDMSTRAVEIPLLIRFSALPLIDFGGGFYFQKFNGTYSTSSPTFQDGSVDWNSNYKQTDFGTKISARLRIPVAPLMHFLVDANYKFGLVDLDKGATSLKSRELGVLAGLAFGF